MTVLRQIGRPVAALALVSLVFQAVSWCCVSPAMATVNEHPAPSAHNGEHCHPKAGAHPPALSLPQLVSSAACESRPVCCQGAGGNSISSVVPALPESVVGTPQPAGSPPFVGNEHYSAADFETPFIFARPVYRSPPLFLRYCSFLE